MGDMADDLLDQIFREEHPILWPDEVDPTMEEQEEIQKKIEAFEKINEDVKNGITPF